MMMSGCGILTNGKGTRRQYGDFNLDELNEGDRIGMMRKTNGNLHFYINGLDQGVGMFSHKKSLITIFGHKHKIKNFIKKFDIFHKEISTAFDFG